MSYILWPVNVLRTIGAIAYYIVAGIVRGGD